eukprot:12217662-Alexandrium_andersonii.AAC.1
MQNRFTRSNLELRGPRNSLRIGPRSPPGERSRNRQLAGSNPQPANPQSAQSFAAGAPEASK